MKRLLALILSLGLLFSAVACAPEEETPVDEPSDETPEYAYSVYTPNEENIVTDEEAHIRYVNNMLMVVFKDDAAQDDIDAVVESVEGRVLETVPSINQYQIQVPEQDLSALSALADQVEQNDCVLFAYYDEVNEMPQNAVVPVDPWNGDVDAADWTDEDIDGSNWWMELIDVYGAWEYSHYFSKIKIGIVDTGFDEDHEDLDLQFPNNLETLNRTLDHGTHVAGIIGAKHNNKGISGIVQKATLLCIPCENDLFQPQWCTDSMVYVGLIQAVESGAKVVNVSMGDNNKKQCSDKTVADRAEKASGHMAVLLQDHDFIVVQSAGNSGRDALYNNYFASITPDNCVTFGTDRASVQGICDRILVVANISSQKQKSETYFIYPNSNGGSQVDIAAPGGVVNSDDSVDIDKGVYSTVAKDRYKALAGTSMAAPMVTGVAALVWSVSDRFTGDQVVDIVLDTATGCVTSDQFNGSFGLVNAEAAVKEAVRLVDNEERQPETGDVRPGAVEYEIVRWDGSARTETGESAENYYYDYLVIKGDSPVFQKLNELLYSRAEKFMTAYSSGEEVASYGGPITGYYVAWTTVTYNQNGILGFTVTADEFLGGNTSHGYFSHYYYDLRTGEEATIDALAGIDAETLLPLLRQIAWEGLEEQVGSALFPGVQERINNMQLDAFKYCVEEGQIWLEFEQYSVTDGTWGDLRVPTGLYLEGTQQ